MRNNHAKLQIFVIQSLTVKLWPGTDFHSDLDLTQGHDSCTQHTGLIYEEQPHQVPFHLEKIITCDLDL